MHEQLRRLRSAGVVLAIAIGIAVSATRVGAEERVSNGVFTNAFPSVGALVKQSSPTSTPRINCSATLVGCETVVTAAHCVCPDVVWCPTPPDPAQFRFFLPSAGYFDVTSIDVPPNYTFAWRGDVAVLKLASPVPNVAPTPINRTGSPPYGTPLTLVGFGYDVFPRADATNPTSVGLKRRGRTTAAACHQVGNDENHVCTKFTSPAGPAGEDSATDNGDSGGAVLVDYGCGSALGAIVSGGLALGSYSSEFYELGITTDVFVYRDFITAHGGADLDAATCGTGGQVGGPGTTLGGFAGRFVGAATRTFTVPPGTAELRVGVTIGNADGTNADVLVGHGAPPTPASNACALTGSTAPRFCRIDAPADGTWYVVVAPTGVSDVAHVQVTVTTIADGSMPPPSNDGTTCDDRSPCTTGETCQARTCGAGTPAPDGTACTDDVPCTTNDACQAGACVGGQQPRTTCARTARPRASKLRLANGANGAQMKWTWKRGESQSFRSGGRPGAMARDAGFAVCLYDEVGGVPELLLSHVVPGDLDIWRTKTSAAKEQDDFIDRYRRFNGTKKLLLKHVGEGKDQFRYDGEGVKRGPVPLPAPNDPGLTAQLVETATGACWEAHFTTASREDGSTYQAVSD